MKNRSRVLLAAVLAGLSLVLSTNVAGQKTVKHVSATAMGTSTQLGRVVSIDLHINSISPPEEQQALMEAFKQRGSEGLANALEKMESRGRIAITGTLGFDLKYIRVFKMDDGSLNVRFVTDRAIRFGEVWADTRSSDYELAMGEFFLNDGKGSTGTLVPASKLNLNKNGQLEIEAFQNPWKLTNIKVWD